MTPLALLLAAAILGLLGWRVRTVRRAEQGTLRGTAPGQGTTTLRAEYSSGIGGGQTTEYTVPKDPQTYARLFVPKTKPKG